MSDMDGRPPRAAMWLLRALLPLAERDEVRLDVEEEYGRRRAEAGRRAADAWVWRQVVASTPALLRRSWWRGTKGFEPEANRLHPGGPMLESWIMDARYSARRLLRRPLYAVLAVLTLALGVGGAGAIYTIVRSLLVDPLPYRAAQELTVFWDGGDWSEREFLYLRGHFTGFQSVAEYYPEDVALQGRGGEARVVPAITSSAELFDVLGVRPALGRGFRAGDDALGAERVAVISWGLWQELGGSPSVLGSRLTMDGTPWTVVGVMPKRFWFPDPSVRVWLAEALDPENGSGNYTLVGRLAPGETISGMGGPLSRITALLAERYQYPEQWDKTKHASLTPIREAIAGNVRPALLATLVAMAAILLMACANVAALMLGQVDGRSTELALRNALGAGRTRLLQQLVSEALLVGLLAGVVGAGVAAVGFPLLLRALPLGALAEGAHADWTLFLSAMAISVGAAVLVAAAPVFTVWRGNLRASLGTDRTSGLGARGGRLESGLVIAEVALAVLMASGAALLIRSVDELRAIDPGLDPTGVAVVDVALPGNMTVQQRVNLVADLLPRLAAIPGVRSVGGVQKLPLRGSGDNWGIRIVSRPELPSTTTAMRIVTPDYFQTLGIALRQGRTFDEADRNDNAYPVVINEALAKKYFPGENPLGQQFVLNDEASATVIGVVADVAEAGLTDAPVPARYMLVDHLGVRQGFSFVLKQKSPGDVARVFEAARRVIRDTNPGIAIQATTTMDDVVARSMGPVRQIRTLLTLLALLALVLGAVGVYGVIAHFVTRQRREIGIRMALGLAPARVVGGVLARGGTLVGIGIVAGVVASLFVARLVASLLYHVGTSDPAALLGATATLLAAGLAAAAIPAWRASRLDPARVLRD